MYALDVGQFDLVDAEQRVEFLEKAVVVVHQLPPHYDDVLREVSERIDASGSVGKSDIATLAFWKRIQTDSWAESFLSLRVREVTEGHVREFGIATLDLDCSWRPGPKRGGAQSPAAHRPRRSASSCSAARSPAGADRPPR
jgi:hypothetical protein